MLSKNIILKGNIATKYIKQNPKILEVVVSSYLDYSFLIHPQNSII